MSRFDDCLRRTGMEGAGSVQGIGVAIAHPRRRDTMEESELFSEVVVVGAGNAALTAALAAREAGAQVLVLEKAPYDDRGGNSRFTGGIVRFAHSGLEDILPLVPDLTEAEVARLDVEPYSTQDYV